jgi:heat shock protein HslJ
MACPNMDTERLVLEALNKVASFTLDQDKSKLSLLDENGTEVMSLTKNTGEALSK